MDAEIERFNREMQEWFDHSMDLLTAPEQADAISAMLADLIDLVPILGDFTSGTRFGNAEPGTVARRVHFANMMAGLAPKMLAIHPDVTFIQAAFIGTGVKALIPASMALYLQRAGIVRLTWPIPTPPEQGR